MKRIILLAVGALFALTATAQVASPTQFGVVKVGSGLTVNAGVISVTLTGGGTTTSVYTVTALTRNAIQAAIDAVSSNATITLAPSVATATYTGFESNPVIISGKTNLTIQGFQNANLTATTGTFFLDAGNNKNIRLTGLNFRNTATSGGGGGQINFNEQGVHNGVEIDHCTFKSPQYRQNAVTGALYSALSDNGSGQGNILRDFNMHDCLVDSMGRTGPELVGHTWNDNKTDMLMFNINIHHNTFKHLGLVAETDGKFNGMAVSISGYAEGVNVHDNYIEDAKLLGIEFAGTRKSSITNNIITNPGSVSFTGISISDNSHNATYDLTINGNNVTTRAKPISLNQVRNATLTGNVFTQTTQNGAGGAVYFQNSTDISLSGGSINAFCFNPIRLDDASNVIIGGGIRIDNQDTNDYASISLYGTTGLTPGFNTIGPEIIYKKRGVISYTNVVEQQGTQANNTIWSPIPSRVGPVVAATLSAATALNLPNGTTVYITANDALYIKRASGLYPLVISE